MTLPLSPKQYIAEEKDDTVILKSRNQLNCIDLIVITTKTAFTVLYRFGLSKIGF